MMKNGKKRQNEEKYEEQSFLDSLDDITPEELVGGRVKRRRRSMSYITSTLMRVTLLLVFFGVFIFCMIKLADSFADYAATDKLYGEMADDFENAINGTSNGHTSSSLKAAEEVGALKNYAQIIQSGADVIKPDDQNVVTSLAFQRALAKLESYKEKNPDIYGWIIVGGTDISYPIMQSDDNEYYLYRNYLGENLITGSIFADFRCHTKVSRNKNLILYGHNSTGGAMFHQLERFLKEDTFRNNKITIYTFDGIYTFEPFSVYPTTSTYQYFTTSFRGDEFVNFCDRVAGMSKFKTDDTFTDDDIILTLSTCISGTTGGRYALHAKLVKIEK